MFDNINLKGHFKIQTIDKNNNVIDEYEDHNMIMESARTSMSEMFANLDSSTFINKFKLGTFGHIGDSILLPKGDINGFVKERDRMFSESITIDINDVIKSISEGDVFEITNATTPGYYRYLGVVVSDYIVSQLVIDTATWELIGNNDPNYTYNINFELPQTNDDLIDGTVAQNISEDDSGSGSTVSVLQTNTSVTFIIDISTVAANEHQGNTSVFTEAALYANNRIFTMKTFKAKIKDNSILLRVRWTITF
jgi:hypothetical protein